MLATWGVDRVEVQKYYVAMAAAIDLERPYLLENTVQEYAWGSPTAIPELLGAANPDGKPQAELWMGAHPKAPSHVLIGEEKVSLVELLEHNPRALLGKDAVERFGPRLPFLFKVLAASKALSIQAHPNLEQAREGYRREKMAGIPDNAPERNYRDDNHKPEVLCALGEFWGMRGFRAPEEIRKDLLDLDFAGAAQLAAVLAEDSSGSGLKRFLRRILETSRDEAERMADSAAFHCRNREGDRFMWVGRLSEEFPGDVGALAPLFLNVVHLKPGEAIYQGAGQLHAYLEGTGIELMANSDNVLRGGLTPKHIDVSELLNVLIFEHGDPSLVERETGEDGVVSYSTPTSEFRLSRISSSRTRTYRAPAIRSVEILLCVGGEAVLSVPGGTSLPIRTGASILVPAAVATYEILGDADIFRADVPFTERT